MQVVQLRAVRVAAFVIAATACLAGSDGVEVVDRATVERLMGEVVPRVEEAVGLEFTSPPTFEIRTHEQVEAYLLDRINQTVPPEELAGFEISLKLFGLIPDTMDLGALLLEFYKEQVVGFYDPDSTTLYLVDHTDPLQLRLVVAHELVHALQDQYTDVDSLLSISRESDRAAASQAVLEGQATLASLLAILTDQDLVSLPGFWEQAREAVLQDQTSMPVFSAAPLILKETAIFPYLAGADWVRWFALEYPDTVPLGRLMPSSTEQILHPEKFLSGDQPVDLRFVEETEARYTDGFGEFSIRVLLHELSGREAVGIAAATDWGGDRFAVFATGTDYGLVWWTVWDTEAAARRFAFMLEREWRGRDTGRRFSVQQTEVEGRPAVRLVDGPDGWVRWANPPGVVVVSAPAN